MDGLWIRTWLLAGVLTLLPAIAAAGTVIETAGSGSYASIIYINDTNVRVESSANAASVTLFDGKAEELIFIDHGTRQYQRVGREDLHEIAQRIASAREAIKQRLQDMPEEHRDEMGDRVEKMLPGREGPADIRIERGDSRTIAGIACREAVVHLGGQPSHAVCVASPETLGLSASAFDTLGRMFAFFGEMTSGLSEGHDELGPRTTHRVMEVLDGVPVRSEAIRDGSSWSVTSIRSTLLSPERFRVPDDYHEVEPISQANR